MKALFTHSWFLRFDAKQWKQQQPYPPLGTLYAAAVLRNEGWDVRLYDTQFETSPAGIVPHLQSFKPDIVVIYDDGFNYLTKMCLTNMREAAFVLCAEGKKAGCKVIVCSSDAADHAEKYLDHGADFVIAGEGEITLKELASAWTTGNDTSSIPGLIYRLNGNLVRTPPREVLRQPDDLPAVVWDLVDTESYRRRWMKSTGYFSLNLSTTRGCPFHCNWCAKPIYGNRYHAHSPRRAVEEIKVLLEKKATHIWMTDDIFGLKPGWVKEFADIVQEEGLRFRFKIQSRVDLLLQDDAVADLARAGCEMVWVGAESGSQKILDAMDKGTRVEQIYEATRRLRAHGIRPAFFLQFGYPGETSDDIKATLDMVNDLMPDDIGISVSYPLPGTKFYDRVVEELKAKGKSNWKDSDELALMFRGTYPAPFYRELQRYVHKSFRIRQGLAALKRMAFSPAAIRREDLRRIAALPVHFPGKLLHGQRMKEMERTEG